MIVNKESNYQTPFSLYNLKVLLSNRTLHNIAYVGGGFGLGKAGLLLAMILLARVYPEEGGVFGKISYAMAFTAFTASIFLTVDIFSVRELTSISENRRKLVSSILLYRLLLATGIYVALVAVAWGVSSNIEERDLILIFGARLFPLALFVGWYFQAIQKMAWFSLSLFIQSWLYVAFIILFINPTTSPLHVPLWSLLAFGISSLFLYTITIKKEGLITFRIDIPLWKKLSTSVAFLAGADLVYLLYMQGSVLVLKILKGYEAAGSFNAMFILFSGVIFLLCNIPTALFPRFVEEIKNGKVETIKLLFEKSLFYMAFIAFPIAAGCALWAKDIAELVYGGKYADAVICFQVLMINVVIMSINTIQNRALIAFGRERTVSIIHIIMGIVGITMNFLLVKYLGLLGSSIALVCAEVVAITLMTISFMRLTGVYFWRYLVWPGISVIAMAVVVVNFLSGINLFIKAGIGFGVYLVLWGFLWGTGLCRIPQQHSMVEPRI